MRSAGVTACHQRRFKWKAKYAEMDVKEVKRLRELEEENAKLKKLLAEAMVDNDALKTLLSKKY